jgi:predicted adenylyl cyclase CyaB
LSAFKLEDQAVMPRNIEIKAKVNNIERLRSLAESIATEPCQVLHQEDVFFPCVTGRLKLRIFSGSSGELIAYKRPDTQDARESEYQVCRTSRPQQLRDVLAQALGETVTVKKKRQVFLVGQTRIHLDEVEELGDFMELEVVLAGDETPDYGREIVARLMKQLEIKESDLVSRAYADLLLKRTEQAASRGQ